MKIKKLLIRTKIIKPFKQDKLNNGVIIDYHTNLYTFLKSNLIGGFKRGNYPFISLYNQLNKRRFKWI